MNRYGHLLSLIRIGPGLVESEPRFRTFSRTEKSDDADPMETGQISPVDTFVMAKGFFWCARDELHEWSLGVEKDEQERLLGLESEKQQIAGLFKASLKHTDSKTQKTYRNWFFMMPRKADGTLALDKPRFAPKDQVKLVKELDKHWDGLRDYSDMSIRRCSVTSQNMSEITGLLDALDAVFRDTDVPLTKPQEVETVINDLIAAGKYQPPATAASPSNAKRGRRSSSPPEGRTEGASDEAEEGQTPGPGGRSLSPHRRV